MTALHQYERLEASGIWRETPHAQRRDVVVSFGDATLVLTDPRSNIPLAHWSLPAVTRVNPGKSPAIYCPGADDIDEELEVDDELMIAAIEKVHRAIESRRPHPGRLRGGLVLLAVVAMVAGAVFWLPPALIRHAAKIAPPAQRAAIGQQVLAEIMQSTGAPCRRPSADPALGRLAARLLPPSERVIVLPTKLDVALRLPGPITVVGANMMADHPDPQVVAGYILSAQQVAAESDPTLEALNRAGFRATFNLLTTGTLPAKALSGYGEELLSRPVILPDQAALLTRFTDTGIASTPFARAIDPSGETTLTLIESDPYMSNVQTNEVLDAAGWEALRRICAE